MPWPPTPSRPLPAPHSLPLRSLEPTYEQPDDLLCPWVLPPPVPGVDPGWVWKDLFGKHANISLPDRRACFMPIKRFSRRALELLNRQFPATYALSEVGLGSYSGSQLARWPGATCRPCRWPHVLARDLASVPQAGPVTHPHV